MDFGTVPQSDDLYSRMADCIAPSTLSDISRKDASRLVGQIAKALAANSPFINILEGGTFPSGTSDQIRTSVQLQAAPGDSLAIPTFVCDSARPLWFKGNILALTSITAETGASIEGRLLARNGAVTLDGNPVTCAA